MKQPKPVRWIERLKLKVRDWDWGPDPADDWIAKFGFESYIERVLKVDYDFWHWVESQGPEVTLQYQQAAREYKERGRNFQAIGLNYTTMPKVSAPLMTFSAKIITDAELESFVDDIYMTRLEDIIKD
jgi:hypothetical protein